MDTSKHKGGRAVSSPVLLLILRHLRNPSTEVKSSQPTQSAMVALTGMGRLGGNLMTRKGRSTAQHDIISIAQHSKRCSADITHSRALMNPALQYPGFAHMAACSMLASGRGSSCKSSTEHSHRNPKLEAHCQSSRSPGVHEYKGHTGRCVVTWLQSTQCACGKPPNSAGLLVLAVKHPNQLDCWSARTRTQWVLS